MNFREFMRFRKIFRVSRHGMKSRVRMLLQLVVHGAVWWQGGGGSCVVQVHSERHSVMGVPRVPVPVPVPSAAAAPTASAASRAATTEWQWQILESLVQVPQQLRHFFEMGFGYVRVYEIHRRETHHLESKQNRNKYENKYNGITVFISFKIEI